MNEIRNIDVSVVVNLHNEGLIAYPTIRSVIAAIDEAESNSVQCELIVILDKSTLDMQNLIENYNFGIDIDIRHTEFGDLGESRNFGANVAQGKYVTFIDGDDLWGEQWIVNCFEFYESENRQLVLHPELNVIFGAEHHLFYHTDMENVDFDIDYLRIVNYWTALSFSLKSIYMKYPFHRNQIRNGFGYEDWNWNCNTIDAGIIHKIAPNTCHFIRRKVSGSMLQDSNKNKCLVTPHNLFDL